MKMCLHLYTKMLKLLEQFYQLFNLLINVTTLGDIFCYKGYKPRGSFDALLVSVWFSQNNFVTLTGICSEWLPSPDSPVEAGNILANHVLTAAIKVLYFHL